MLTGPFRFDTERHEYTVGGIVVPGIHTVLKAGGLEPEGTFYTAEHRERGKAVHLATLMHDLGDTSIELPDEWRPYFDAYLKFRAEVACKWRRLEHPKVHRRLRYATIIDREGLMSGRPAICEIKTGYPAPFHGPQLAGADMLLGRTLGARRRMAVYLRSDRTYKLQEYTEAADYHRFLQSVRTYWVERDALLRPCPDTQRAIGFATD